MENRDETNIVFSTGKTSDNENDEDLTPTNTEVKATFENESLGGAQVRLCISPNESENSSGGSTPDALDLNKAPFDIKLVPKLASTKEKNPQSEKEIDSLKFKTPEKLPRPINFKNLSPRSVTYEFSTRYASGPLRPVKVRRSFQSLHDLKVSSSPETSDTYFDFTPRRPNRAQSEDLSRSINFAEKSPLKKRTIVHVRRATLSDDTNNNSMEVCINKTVLDESPCKRMKKLTISKNNSSDEEDDVF